MLELRARGLCRVKYNPYIVEYKKGNIIVKIRMEHLQYYPKAKLEEARELSGSILYEEITTIEEIINAMEEQEDHG